MTKEQLRKANSINAQIETLEHFLESNRRACDWIKFFKAPKKHCDTISVHTTYNFGYPDEVTCSKRLSESITKAIENEVSILYNELDRITKNDIQN